MLYAFASGDMIYPGTLDQPFSSYGYVYKDGFSLLPEGEETYLAVQFIDESDVDWHAGWIGVVRTAGGDIDAFAWGYETEPGVPIAAGAMGPCSSNADCDDGSACTADSCNVETGH
ncbi:hypothetical protein LCGC14_3103570, partial [marine sediment metagenome]